MKNPMPIFIHYWFDVQKEFEANKQKSGFGLLQIMIFFLAGMSRFYFILYQPHQGLA